MNTVVKNPAKPLVIIISALAIFVAVLALAPQARATSTADFYAYSTSGNAPLNVQFYNNTPNAVTWTWDFGDGSPTESEPNPPHTYSKPGVYTVTLTTTGDGTSTTQKVGYITVTDAYTGNVVLYFQSGRILDFPGTVVTVYTGTMSPANQLGTSKRTGSDGSTSFSLVSGTSYVVHAAHTATTGGQDTSLGNVDFDLTFTFTPSESSYYVDVLTSSVSTIAPYSRIVANPTHACTVVVKDWNNFVTGATLSIYESGSTIICAQALTDDKGEMDANFLSSVSYKIHIYKTGDNPYDVTHTYYSPGTTLTIPLGSFNMPGLNIFRTPGDAKNDQTSETYIPESVHALIYVDGNKIIANVNDSSKIGTMITCTLSTWDTGKNQSLILTSVSDPSSAHNFTFDLTALGVTDPISKNFEVKVQVQQPGGLVTQFYDYTWPGPTWRLPGVPVEFYCWISIGIIGAIFLGCASRLNIGIAGITGAIATAFMAQSGWLWQWGPTIWPIIIFVCIMSIFFYWRQIARGEI